MEIHTIKNCSTACDILNRLQHIDALGESLEKAHALTLVLCSAWQEDYGEDVLEWFSAAILDNLRIANHSWKTLEGLQ